MLSEWNAVQNEFLQREKLQSLLDVLADRGYEVIGPRVEQGAIVYDQVSSVDELPVGWTDQQEPGRYRLVRRSDSEVFGYVVGPHSWKKYLFPPNLTVLHSKKSASGWEHTDPPQPARRFAFLGVRACEIAALAIQDRVFLSNEYVDPVYRQRREQAFIVAVQCTLAAPTCFCSSMNTGPEARGGFDLALTELEEGFVLQIASPRGTQVAAELPLEPVTDDQLDRASKRRARAVHQITRSMNTEGLRETLLSRLDHPRWDEVADRCLSCANCTLVCPTCFCCSVDEVTDLVQDEVRRERRWDSCFNFDFSHIAGGPVRNTIRARYRQWLTHKLASWHDQFDTSGCVGCGRCITWCPVGIDITQEVAAICDSPT